MSYDQYKAKVVDTFCDIARSRARDPENFDDEWIRRRAEALDYNVEFGQKTDAAETARRTYEAMV